MLWLVDHTRESRIPRKAAWKRSQLWWPITWGFPRRSAPVISHRKRLAVKHVSCKPLCDCWALWLYAVWIINPNCMWSDNPKENASVSVDVSPRGPTGRLHLRFHRLRVIEQLCRVTLRCRACVWACSRQQGGLSGPCANHDNALYSGGNNLCTDTHTLGSTTKRPENTLSARWTCQTKRLIRIYRRRISMV